MNTPFIEDALRQYAAALENGELDGAGRYFPGDLLEQADLLADELRPINVVFDGPPSATAPRFVEVETDDGESICVGEWIERKDGLWSLRISCPPAPYTQLEIEHCIAIENRWGDSFVEAIHDLERAALSDVLEEFWTIYGRDTEGKANCLHDTDSHDKAVEIAGVLSICAFNSIPVVDNSPEGRNDG